MKTQVINDLRAISVTELAKKVAEIRTQIVNEQLKKTTGETKDVRITRKLQRKLAVALSILREKQLAKE